MGNKNPGIGATQEAFLKQKFNSLSNDEKLVSVMLDEIYVDSSISYKGGKVIGIPLT